jgi:hypothetical protein
MLTNNSSDTIYEAIVSYALKQGAGQLFSPTTLKLGLNGSSKMKMIKLSIKPWV